MNRREMYNFMIRSISGSPGGCEELTPEILEETEGAGVLPAAFLPHGNYEEAVEFMAAHELDGMSWDDVVPAELGNEGRLWVRRDDILWVAGVVGGGPSRYECYWCFKAVAN